MSRRPCEPSSRNRGFALRRVRATAIRPALAILGLTLGTAENALADDEASSGTVAVKAKADPDSAPITPPIELRHDLRIDLPVTAGLIATYTTILLARDDLQSKECGWCDGSNPSDLNAIDDWFRTALRRADPQPANVMSHVLAFGVAPITLVGTTVLSAWADRRTNGALVDVVLATEGAFSAVVVTELMKPLILRERPRIHAIADPEARQSAIDRDPDAVRGFPSGHTSSVFAATAAAGMVATMRGYRLAPLVWASGILLGVATAYARMAADRHYFTDTLGGAAIGLFVGGGVPLLFHRPTTKQPPTLDARGLLERTTLSTTPVPGGRLVGVSLAF
jgi:membrane-associated phospholipid phosphatase